MSELEDAWRVEFIEKFGRLESTRDMDDQGKSINVVTDDSGAGEPLHTHSPKGAWVGIVTKESLDPSVVASYPEFSILP